MSLIYYYYVSGSFMCGLEAAMWHGLSQPRLLRLEESQTGAATILRHVLVPLTLVVLYFD